MFGVVLDFFKNNDVEYLENCSIKKESKIKIGANARLMASPDTEEKLIKIVKFAKEYEIKHKVVGAMSNILPCDNDYDGIIIKTSKINTYSVAENVL